MRKVVVVSAKRTPIGSFLGYLSSFTAPQLGSLVIKNIIKDINVDVNLIDEVIMGNVLTAGLGQAPARQAALYAGLPDKTECLTINKMCGSGLKAVMLAQQSIALGDTDVIIAGGQESMSNAPYIIPGLRTGLRLGNNDVIDSVLKDGLWDVYNDIHMGNCAEACAKDFKFTREQVDEFTIKSYKRSIAAQQSGRFRNEIVEVAIKTKEGETIINKDEEPLKVKFEKIPSLKPVFDKNGIVTAANSSKINDGAAALLLCDEITAKKLGYKPLVEIIAHSSSAKAPINFTTAPADAIKKVLNKADMILTDIDLFEINEAFAVVSLAVNKILELDDSKVNVNGGAVSLGHPIGASGARILVTLIHELKKQNLDYGLASLCIGGGEASAMIVKNYRG